MKLLKGLIWLALMGVAIAAAAELNASLAQPLTYQIKSEEIKWQEPAQFANGASSGLEFTASGISIANDARIATYKSPELEAPFPFNALFSRWQMTGETGEENDSHSGEISPFSLAIRTRSAAGIWSAWAAIEPDPDMTLPGDSYQTGTIVIAPAEDERHTHYQFMLTLSPTFDDKTPELDWMRFTFIDSVAAPNTAELSPEMPAAELTAAGYPKPPVVSRAQWCQSQPTLSCTYSNGLEYVPVTHLVLHHTVTSNSSGDWAATVRAIWFFHGDESGNGWGDIGYNYLVAPDGVIYEGHYGGDNVAGTHAAFANHGSMGVAMLGNYTSQNPPWLLRDSLADLYAWKADQQDIDVYDSSKLPNEGNNVTDRGLPHLMGHRDVYGGGRTSCPGGMGHPWLPWLKDQIAIRTGFASPHIYFEEYENGADTTLFTKANANWHVPANGCGNDLHAYYTFSTKNPSESTNWGIWQPNLPFTGRYEVEVYAPYCDTGEGESYGAKYEIHHNGGVSYRWVNQQSNIGLWTSLGEFDFNAGNGGWLKLTDLTTSDEGRAVWFDAIRYRLTASSLINQAPANGVWLNNGTVNFQWLNQNVPNSNGTTIQVATDAAMSQIVAQPWVAAGISQRNITFGQSYQTLYWRVIAHHPGVADVYSNITQFGLDSELPWSKINFLFELAPHTYAVGWDGDDAISGISSYNIEYRLDGSATWHTCQANVTGKSGICVVPTNALYWFRSVAKDNAGNFEALSSGDINSNQAIIPTHFVYLPIVAK